MNPPIQAPPVSREPVTNQSQQGVAAQQSRAGVMPSQTPCDHLRGLAQQMCYAVKYGVSY